MTGENLRYVNSISSNIHSRNRESLTFDGTFSAQQIRQRKRYTWKKIHSYQLPTEFTEQTNTYIPSMVISDLVRVIPAHCETPAVKANGNYDLYTDQEVTLPTSYDDASRFLDQSLALTCSPTGSREAAQQASSLSFPLTKKNLTILQSIMDPPSTPAPSNASGGKIEISTSSYTSKDSEDDRYLQECHGLDTDNADAETRHPSIFEKARQIYNDERGSLMTSASAKKVLEKRQKYEGRNEDTFVANVWCNLMKEHRTLEDPDVKTMIIRDWKDDHLDANVNLIFRPTSLENLKTSTNPTTVGLLNQLDRLRIPKPDLTFGLSKEAFTQNQQLVNKARSNLTGISPGIWHPFFLVEFKGGKIPIEEAETQSCRGGAAMIHALRQLLQEADKPIENADAATLCFSLALTPSIARLHVHWAEFDGNESLKFHQHTLEEYLMRDQDHLRRLRAHVDNIFDWGILRRKREVQEILDIIAQKPPSSKRSRSKKQKLKHSGA